MLLHLQKCSLMIFATTNGYRKLNCRYLMTTTKLKRPSTVSTEEVKKFDTQSGKWWIGKNFNLLHLYNSLRVPLIRDGILSVTRSNKNLSKPLKGYSILDVGCGGGILSEPLARLGAKVTGLDPGLQNVQIATEHASKEPEIKENLTYICDTVENLVLSDNRYDAVVASEVIEHVNNVPAFVNSCVELTKSNGSLFFTTINRTYTSYILSIMLGEYVLNMIPKGTHEWNKFILPKELIEMLESLNCRIISNEGVMYNPIMRKFFWCKNTDNFYTLHAVKL